MAKIAAVLLNYNDSDTTVKACDRLLGFGNIDQVILVDNASTDGSAETLKSYVKQTGGTFPPCRRSVPVDRKQPRGTFPLDRKQSTGNVPIDRNDPASRVTLILNDRNGGYGYGNNRGADAAKALGCDYALIANPDVMFTEKTVQKLADSLEKDNASVSGALMEGARFTDCAWPLLSLTGELAYAGPFTKRLFKRSISYPRAFFKMLPAPVGAVHGSLFMVNLKDFYAAGGFDERVFLFMEEKILGQRMAAIGKRVVLTDAVYKHAGSGSMKKAGLDSVNRQKERQKAERFYYKNYLHAGMFGMLLVRLQQAAVLLETKLAAKAGRI